MASYNSFHGRKMHGNREMLTDVLVGRMGFDGFVVGDWNGHGQVEGCTNTSCAASLNAGLDMFMAPDSWEDLYQATLAQVGSGEITMERLDEAVSRARRQSDDKILSAETVRIDGRRVHRIKVLTSRGRVKHVQIDADTGRPAARRR